MYRLDVGTRPDEADEDAYERMPIEMFGKAYLRGYDWKDGDGMKDATGKEVEAVEVGVGLGLVACRQRVALGWPRPRPG